jgi:hypothetical protein
MKRQNFYDSFSELRFFDRFGNAERRAQAVDRLPRVSRVTVSVTFAEPIGFLASSSLS